jgi:hypothetical protein
MTLQRKTILRQPVKEAKPVKGPRTKKCSLRGCLHRFVPTDDPRVTWCSSECGAAVALALIAARRLKLAKVERAEAKQKKITHPTQKEITKLEDAAQAAVNRVAVLRDWEDGCISCEKGPHWSGTWHGSHYKSVGSNSALRYNLWNISKACSECNWHKSGNITNYVPRLEKKFGADRLEWLQNHPRMRDYSPEYLVRLATVMRKKIRRMEKRLGLRK